MRITAAVLSSSLLVLCVAAVGSSGTRTLAQAHERPQAATRPYLGSHLYRTYCAVCHGKAARGDGPLADQMKTRPPALTHFAQRNGGTYPSALVARIIDGRQPLPGHGGPDMPVWGDVFKASRTGSSEAAVKARIDALVNYLESLQEKQAQ